MVKRGQRPHRSLGNTINTSFPVALGNEVQHDKKSWLPEYIVYHVSESPVFKELSIYYKCQKIVVKLAQ